MSMKEKHKKHGNITRPSYGTFGRREVAILGDSCDSISEFIQIIRTLFPTRHIAYVDADHRPDETPFLGTHLQVKRDCIELIKSEVHSEYSNRILVSDSDLVLINGNHFQGQQQIVFCNAEKENSLRKRESQLTNVRALVIGENQAEIPEYINWLIPQYAELPQLRVSNLKELKSFFQQEFLDASPLRALILTGGKSLRMGEDKALIKYHKDEQFLHLKKILDKLSIESYVSCRKEQEEYYKQHDCRTIQDSVLNMGPLGGIVSAFMQYPDSAWLVLACDIPLLDELVIQELIGQRKIAQVATAFKSPITGWPEPLIAIWEPKSYMKIMEFIALGVDCPRKILINTAAQVIEPLSPEKLKNINTLEERTEFYKGK